ncbi:MDR family MFS transporter [Streptomyces odontomachi]|uniref:MDR family MFS transporter n=1 Tax=Streptomyces odontomachi TaxID=2944940 RepID=UPI00210C2641|nr:MDR family MFS transporter [Streptomyces sp. ODS25]
MTPHPASEPPGEPASEPPHAPTGRPPHAPPHEPPANTPDDTPKAPVSTPTPTPAPTPLDPALLRLGVVIVVGSVTALLDMTMVTVALADLSRTFGASVTTVQWVSAGYLLAIASVVPVTGRLAERFGTRTVWLCALTAFAAGSALCGAAWSVGSLIAFRAVQGVGGGMIVPLSMMILARAADPDQRGRVMSIAAVPGQVAPIAGPLLGGLIVDGPGWRWIFYVNVPICAIALLLARRDLPHDAPSAGAVEGGGRWLDPVGLALLSPGLALAVYGLSGGAWARRPLLAAGLVLLVAFCVHALRPGTVMPLLDLRLFRHRALAAATALNFLSRLSVFGASVLLPLYFQLARGDSALVTGLLLAPQSVGTMVALPYVGRLTDRIGARPVVLAGIAVTALGTLVFTQVTAHTDLVLLCAARLVWGAGVAAVAVPVSAAAYDGLAPEAIPGATSAITAMQTVGASVGAAVLTAILGSRVGHHPGAIAAAFADTFWWVLGFSLLTVVPTLLLPLRRPDRHGARPRTAGHAAGPAPRGPEGDAGSSQDGGRTSP